MEDWVLRVHHGDPRQQGIDDGIVIGMVLGRKFLN
jgi:hypothetical protein